MLEASKKVYQKLYLENENLKKSMKNIKRNYLSIETITEVLEQKIKLLGIERLNLVISSLMKKLITLLFATQIRKTKKRRYYAIMITFILMMAWNVTTNLMRMVTRVAMRRFSKRRKKLKQGREL